MRVWMVTAILLAVALAPVFDAPAELGDVSHDVQLSSPLQTTVSPTTGWTAGGQEITITGSGFLDLADRNVTDDGQTHQWAQTTADYSDEAGRWNAVAVDSNGHVHVVHIKDTSYQLRHSVYDGTGWSSSAIKNCGKTYCWDVHMVIDGNDELHVAYTTYTSSRETLEYMHHDGTTWTSTEVTPSALFGPVGIAVQPQVWTTRWNQRVVSSTTVATGLNPLHNRQHRSVPTMILKRWLNFPLTRPFMEPWWNLN